MSAVATLPQEGRAFVKASVIAKRYDITVPSVYRWAKEDKIPSVTFQGTVRFDIEAVRAVIEGGAKLTPSTPSPVTALASAASELGKTLTGGPQ